MIQIETTIVYQVRDEHGKLHFAHSFEDLIRTLNTLIDTVEVKVSPIESVGAAVERNLEAMPKYQPII